jgi:hypothetical protein
MLFSLGDFATSREFSAQKGKVLSDLQTLVYMSPEMVGDR